MIYKCKDNNNMVRRIGRKKKLNCSYTGRFYFVWRDVRYYLDDIMKLDYPVFFYRDDHILDFCGGYICLSNCYGVLVSVDDCGEYVELFEEIEM